jgi:hypothetical protein
MKNINEIEETLKILNDQYEEIKTKYNQHAAFNISLKTNHSHFVNEKTIDKTFICCDDEWINDLSISTFPFYQTNDFARLLHVKCDNCATTWVPSFDFDLDKYYEKRYAHNVQPWREYQGEFYSKNNAFLKSKTYKTMLNRAMRHVNLLNIVADESVLEIGPGVGIALSIIPSKYLYASELDIHCQKILQKELNVQLIDIQSTTKKFDKILISHVIEHLRMDELTVFLKTIKGLLKNDSELLIEVPCGADQVERVSKDGGRGNVIFEPHTISFSTYGLYKILSKSGFDVRKISLDKSFKNLAQGCSSNLINSNCEILSEDMSGGGVVCICRID